MDEIKATNVLTPPGARLTIEKEFFRDGVTSEQIKMLDRIEDQFREVWAAGYRMAEMVGETPWSNSACMGYAILGAKKLGYKDDHIKKLVRAINSQFDFKTVAEATKIYSESPY